QEWRYNCGGEKNQNGEKDRSRQKDRGNKDQSQSVDGKDTPSSIRAGAPLSACAEIALECNHHLSSLSRRKAGTHSSTTRKFLKPSQCLASGDGSCRGTMGPGPSPGSG